MGIIELTGIDWILIAVSIVSLLAFFILLIYILVLKKQFRSVKEQLKKTEQNDYNKPVTVELVDSEFSEMVASFNHNLDYQKKLKLMAEKAENRMKQQVADISHDLRTPITVVKGNLWLMEEMVEKTHDEKQQKYLDTCIRQTDNLKEMIDNFFELSVLESDDESARLINVDVTNALINFIIDHESLIRSHGLTPSITLPEKQIMVKADEGMLERIFSNLLNNIVKYAKESFRVSLVEKEEGIFVSFSNRVTDSSELSPERLFDRTYRGGKERKGNGAGLGLYIVKLLCEKQGIQISANIEDEILSVVLKFERVE